jgi:capsular exopolysaccharide synthesis family protein
VTREIRLSDYVQLLRRQRWVIVGITLATMLVGILLSSSQSEVYASSATVRIAADPSAGVFEEEAVDENNRSRELVTAVEILTSPAMRDEVIDRLGAQPVDFEAVDAELLGFSEIIEITVRAGSPVVAAEVANLYATTFVELRTESAVGVLNDQVSELRAQAAESTAELAQIDAQLADPALGESQADGLRANREVLVTQLQQYTGRADQLDVIAALRAQSTEIVSPAEIEPDPVAPDVRTAGVAGAVLGLLGGLGLAVVRDLLRDRVTGPEDVNDVAPSVPVLATVPHIDRAATGDPMRSAPPAAREGYRYLRTSLGFHALESRLRSVMVTSSLSGEGKTTTAVNLAKAAKAAGLRVALLDCDLRRPSIHAAFDVPASPGLSSVLVGEVPFEDAMRFPEDGLALLTAGRSVQNPSELLGSRRFSRLLAQITKQADLTILDVPPVLPVADPIAVGALVDGIVVVARVGVVRRKDLATTLERLREAGLPVIGAVVNDSSASSSYDAYEPAPPTQEDSGVAAPN